MLIKFIFGLTKSLDVRTKYTLFYGWFTFLIFQIFRRLSIQHFLSEPLLLPINVSKKNWAIFIWFECVCDDAVTGVQLFFCFFSLNCLRSRRHQVRRCQIFIWNEVSLCYSATDLIIEMYLVHTVVFEYHPHDITVFLAAAIIINPGRHNEFRHNRSLQLTSIEIKSPNSSNIYT